MNKEERKELSAYLENYGAYDLADEFNTQVFMTNTQEFNDLVLLYYFREKNEVENLQQENQLLKEQLKDEEDWRIKCAKERDEAIKDGLKIVQENQSLKEEKKRLLEIAKKMHLYIFLNITDEQKAYDEIGLTDEENAMLGYSGEFVLKEVE